MKTIIYCVYSQYNALGVGTTPELAMKNAQENFDFSTGTTEKFCLRVKYARDSEKLIAAQEISELCAIKIIPTITGDTCKIKL